MTIFQTIIFAIVEGLTEFIPVSSSANILLAEQFFPVINKELFASFSIFIQLGAILAVMTLFFRQLWESKKSWLNLIIAIIPTIIMGLGAYAMIKDYLQDASALTGWMLIIGGLFFSYLDWHWAKKSPASAKIESLDDEQYLQETQKSPWWKMALVGVAQGCAIVPGVSRSGATIFGARALGFTKVAATKLSFVLALPTIAGAAGYELYQEFKVMGQAGSYSVFNQGEHLWLMLLGFVVAYLVAASTVKFFMKILATKPFYYWGIYRLITGLVWLYLFI